MNPTLLEQQFERLSRNPGDVRLLKRLAVELGASLIRSKPEAIRAYRVAAASALRVFEAAQANDPAIAKTRAALETLLDTAASAEEALTAERDRDRLVVMVALDVRHEGDPVDLEGPGACCRAFRIDSQLGCLEDVHASRLFQRPRPELVGLIGSRVGQKPPDGFL